MEMASDYESCMICTKQIDWLKQENARLREALESLRNDYSFGNGRVYDDIAKALGEKK